MPKKAPTTDSIDPVRSRLAGAVAAPVPKREAEPAKPEPAVVQKRPPVAPKTQNGHAVQISESIEVPRRKPVSKPKAMTVNRKFLVTPQEAEQMEETLRVISSAFGSKVTYSQVSRAMWTILAGVDEGLRAAGRRAPQRSVPSTGDALGMAEYEEAVADFLGKALKRS